MYAELVSLYPSFFILSNSLSNTDSRTLHLKSTFSLVFLLLLLLLFFNFDSMFLRANTFGNNFFRSDSALLSLLSCFFSSSFLSFSVVISTFIPASISISKFNCSIEFFVVLIFCDGSLESFAAIRIPFTKIILRFSLSS